MGEQSLTTRCVSVRTNAHNAPHTISVDAQAEGAFHEKACNSHDGVCCSLLAIPAAYAHDADIRSDWRHIQRDRARCTRMKRACATSGANSAPQNGARTGRCATAGIFRPGAERLERREAADVRALERKSIAIGADLAHERADLRRDRRGGRIRV